MNALSRRAIQRATAASAALAAPTVALSAAGEVDAPLLALEAHWRKLLADNKRMKAEWLGIHNSLPPHAQGGYPEVPLDGADGLFPLHRRGKVIGLRELRAFNNACIFDDQHAWGNNPARLARIRAEGRERVRWWVNIRRESRRLRAESGFDEVDERWDQIQDALNDIEDEILATPGADIEGLRIKLAVLARMSFIQHSNFDDQPEPPEEWGAFDRAIFDLHAEAERMTGRAQA